MKGWGMKILYCDCFSGISGDMFLGAMLDLGMPLEVLSDGLAKLGLPEFQGVKVNKVKKGALVASQIEFDLAKSDQEDIRDHEHEHGQVHQHSSALEHHRHLSDILELIQASKLPVTVKRQAADIFQKLGEAEARVHGTTLEEVHFHEVGAADSILDIVGAALALHYFQVEQVYASSVPLGSGRVHTQHGWLPLPAPAALELLTMSKARVVPSEADKELVTPTGAAILASLAKFEQPGMSLSGIGLGAGQNELPWPNVLRLLLGESEGSPSRSTHVEIETNIDDMNPQFYASILQHLLANGALDVYFTPIQMKKNRPATKISVIATAADEAALSQVLLRETSTLGVRVKELQRREADREIKQVQMRYGEISVKLKLLDGKVIQAAPEFDGCQALAEQLHLPVAEVYREALVAAAVFLTR